MKRRTLWTWIIIIVAGVIILTVVSIFLETNPAVVKEPNWDSPQTRDLAVRACFDCHSNQTQWPWYTKLPVGAWLAAADTVGGRQSLNFSEWGVAPSGVLGAGGGEAGTSMDRIVRVIQNGSMPPGIYTMMHPNAILNDQEKQQLIDGLQKSLQ